MSEASTRIHQLREARSSLARVVANAANVVVIHYSCESFYDRPNGASPRITSIAVRNLSSAQTKSFSIHQIAEEQHVQFENISERYDVLERAMLDRFFDFLRTRSHCNWIHWNMRDVNYGFAAIEHRYRVLGGTPVQVSEDRKFDLSRVLVDIYGVSYIGHPRLEKLIELNKITVKDFMTGKQEAEAFDKKEFVKLHQSTLRKVDTLANIFDRASNKQLKTNSTWADRNGFKPAVVGELAKEHWVTTGLIALGGLLTLVIRGFELSKLFIP